MKRKKEPTWMVTYLTTHTKETTHSSMSGEVQTSHYSHTACAEVKQSHIKPVSQMRQGTYRNSRMQQCH